MQAAAPGEPADTEEAPKPARRRSTRTKKDDGEQSASAEAPKPATRRPTRAKKDDGESAGTEEAPKPARRRSTRTKKDDGETVRVRRGTQARHPSPDPGKEGRRRTVQCVRAVG